MSVNRPLFIPAGVRLVALQPDEDVAPIDRAVITCEGPCRPSWTPHKRASASLVIAGGDTQAGPSSATTVAMPSRYVCEHCNTSRRWGST